jgi:hypothetical protein
VPTTTNLNQINALIKGYKGQALRTLTDAHRTVQKGSPLSGLSRTYQPDVDGDTIFPAESTRVQINVADVLGDVRTAVGRLFDLQLTQDASNCVARADVRVGDTVILADVPVTYLLFLEKQLTDLRTFIDGLPTLDPSEQWTEDPERGGWATDPVVTLRTVKELRNHVRAEATDKHPAQVEVFGVDVPKGKWTTVKLSGALPAVRVRELSRRVNALREAVVSAREEANTRPVEDRKAGDKLFNYLFG